MLSVPFIKKPGKQREMQFSMPLVHAGVSEGVKMLQRVEVIA
jgi:hypothetical protein